MKAATVSLLLHRRLQKIEEKQSRDALRERREELIKNLIRLKKKKERKINKDNRQNRLDKP